MKYRKQKKFFFIDKFDVFTKFQFRKILTYLY